MLAKSMYEPRRDLPGQLGSCKGCCALHVLGIAGLSGCLAKWYSAPSIQFNSAYMGCTMHYHVATSFHLF